MGVPTFFKWLCQKYPKVILPVTEESYEIQDETSAFIPADKCAANPSGIEFDNLYLDMNGIIHPCSHPEGGAAQPYTEDEMYLNVCTYIDRVMNCVRPRKLLYMAIDGVAPRAKMNQQRLRRFKAAQERKSKRDLYDNLKAEFEAEGRNVPPYDETWDHNVITPGTPFMDRLTSVIQYYIIERQAHDPSWKNLVVILSDANVPGEGEHKIMDFVRSQRMSADYDPSMTHCIYGMDADLIMLGLATHEPKWYIIREEMTMDQKPTCAICGQEGHWASDCDPSNLDDEEERERLAESGMTMDDVIVSEVTYEPPVDPEGVTASSKAFKSSWKPFQFISVSVLREYLYMEFAFTNTPFTTNEESGGPIIAERCIDDFILICFFVGNDFLPHLPALSIHKGSIDQMMLLYKKLLPTLGDYLTNCGYINFHVLYDFCWELGIIEGDILRSDYNNKERKKKNEQKE